MILPSATNANALPSRAVPFLGYSFYVITRLPKFGSLLGKGKLRLIRSELKAILDFLLGRYGDYDRKRANSHV